MVTDLIFIRQVVDTRYRGARKTQAISPNINYQERNSSFTDGDTPSSVMFECRPRQSVTESLAGSCTPAPLTNVDHALNQPFTITIHLK
jgi:hypothetical protein